MGQYTSSFLSKFIYLRRFSCVLNFVFLSLINVTALRHSNFLLYVESLRLSSYLISASALPIPVSKQVNDWKDSSNTLWIILINIFFNDFYLFIFYLFLDVLGLYCRMGFSLVAASQSCSSLLCMGFLLQWRLLLRRMGSRVHRLQ